MNISVTPELERFIHDLVAAGRYRSASEAVRDGLRLLEQSERRRLLEKFLVEGLAPDEVSRLPLKMLKQARFRIEAKIQEGLDALERGDVVDGREFINRWRERLKGSAAERHPELKRRTRKK